MSDSLKWMQDQMTAQQEAYQEYKGISGNTAVTGADAQWGSFTTSGFSSGTVNPYAPNPEDVKKIRDAEMVKGFSDRALEATIKLHSDWPPSVLPLCHPPELAKRIRVKTLSKALAFIADFASDIADSAEDEGLKAFLKASQRAFVEHANELDREPV